ncbi:MAG: hemagglutinin protein [Flavobacteriales bacterium]|nr:hemagglutinin protein [Flavobacteriales bacterium]
MRNLMTLILPPAALLLAFASANAQTLISPAGSSTSIPGGSVSWSVGEPVIGTGTVPGGIITQGFQQPNTVKIRLNIAALLEGPYVSASGLMSDALRSGGLVPLTEPYTALGYGFVGGGGETTTAPVLAVTGNDAIVDWVLVELRDANDATAVVAAQSALVQRDGDIVATDGVSPISFNKPPGEYHIAVFHRNHLGVMTFAPVTLASTPTVLDFTLVSTPTYGTNARKDINGVEVLWAGDVTFNGQIKYAGGGNDRDPILVAIGGTVPTATVTGYLPTDVTMDGTVKYAGANNDRDPILVNIGGTVPTAVRVEQVP